MREQWGVPVLASILILSLGLQPPPASAAVIDVDWSLAAGDQGTITINQGDTVTWTWTDGMQHSVVGVVGPVFFNSGVFQGLGTTFSFTFDEPGNYSVLCGVHIIMTIDIIVLSAPSGPSEVGGTILPIDTTALLVAVAQTTSLWLILGAVSAVGIGLAVFLHKRSR